MARIRPFSSRPTSAHSSETRAKSAALTYCRFFPISSCVTTSNNDPRGPRKHLNELAFGQASFPFRDITRDCDGSQEPRAKSSSQFHAIQLVRRLHSENAQHSR